MGSRAPNTGNTATDGCQNNTIQVPSKAIVKETQREVNGRGTPRQSKKEGAAKAQDVAALKDYVSIPYGICCVLSGNTSDSSKATGGLFGKGCLWLCLQSIKHGHRRNGGR